MSTDTDPHNLWQAGYGPIRHSEQTRERITALAIQLVASGRGEDEEQIYAMLVAADRQTCAGMNVLAHTAYARRVDLVGQPLAAEYFEPVPDGHTGGSLTMVPAFVSDLLADGLSGRTRAWLMVRFP